MVVGAGGLLGESLVARFGGGGPVAAIDSRRLLARLEGEGRREVANLCKRADARQDWLFAFGNVNPKSDPAELQRANVDLPLRLYDAVAGAASAQGLTAGAVRIVTFGSILENREAIGAANPYLASKSRLKMAWQDRASRGGLPWVHFQLHTLYGRRKPHDFMFLGQMEKALRERTPFLMSAGEQVREYHHVDDVAGNVIRYLQGAASAPERIELNSGNTIRLKSLAEAVFRHFGLDGMMRVGALAAQRGDVIEGSYARSPHCAESRDAVEGIAAWLEGLGIRKAGT